MEVASEQRRPRTDVEVVEAAIEQLKAVSKDKRRRGAAKKVLAEDVEFVSVLRRCLLADQPPLEVVIRVGPDIIFNALTSQDVPIQNVQGIVARLQKIDTEAVRQLWLSLIAYCIGVGCQPDTDWFASTPETSLPPYASSHASGLFTAIQTWLEDEALPEYKKRKLAAILIRSLPNLRGSAEQLLSVMPSVIRSLRNSRVDPGIFSAKVLQDWTDQVQRLPRIVAIELAQVVSERSDGYQTRFWDEKKLGPLSALVSRRQPSSDESSGASQAETLKAVDVPPEAQQRTRQREEPRPEPQVHQQPGLSSPAVGATSPESANPQFPSFLKWLSELHAQLGTVLQTATENVQLKQQLLETQQKLASAERSCEDAVEQLKAREAAAAETESTVGRLRQLHEEDSAALKKERSRSEWLEKRIADLENLGRDAENRIAGLKAELDEASRSRILYGEQRATEVKNSLRERISAEVSGLPTLGPELSQDNFSMLRVRFRNLLKLLHDSGVLDGLPGEPAR